mmetsp:Transcript_33453/g.53870  ORF Transcript_33453/g.53870 Transcript_33453/m.53870 type:complete len:220 (+) Transcript_33453:849-1508(+)
MSVMITTRMMIIPKGAWNRRVCVGEGHGGRVMTRASRTAARGCRDASATLTARSDTPLPQAGFQLRRGLRLCKRVCPAFAAAPRVAVLRTAARYALSVWVAGACKERAPLATQAVCQSHALRLRVLRNCQHTVAASALHATAALATVFLVKVQEEEERSAPCVPLLVFETQASSQRAEAIRHLLNCPHWSQVAAPAAAGSRVEHLVLAPCALLIQRWQV